MSTKNQQHLQTWVPECIAIILTLIALRKDNPYSYYIMLRWAVCPIMIWVAVKAYQTKQHIALVVVSATMALLFNPLIRVMLNREKWEILNLLLIGIAAWSAIASFKARPSRN